LLCVIISITNNCFGVDITEIGSGYNEWHGRNGRMSGSAMKKE
jgi:hypothetical protein